MSKRQNRNSNDLSFSATLGSHV